MTPKQEIALMEAIESIMEVTDDWIRLRETCLKIGLGHHQAWMDRLFAI